MKIFIPIFMVWITLLSEIHGQSSRCAVRTCTMECNLRGLPLDEVRNAVNNQTFLEDVLNRNNSTEEELEFPENAMDAMLAKSVGFAKFNSMSRCYLQPIIAREPPKKPSYNAIEEPKAGKLPLGDNKAIKAALSGVPFGLSPVEVYPPYLPDSTNQNSIAVIFSEDPIPNSPPRPRVKKSFLQRMMEKLTKPFSSQKSQAAKAVPRPSFSPSNLYGATLFVNLLNEDCITGETCDLYGNALPEDSELETKEEILNLVQEIGETDFQCQVPICSTIIPQHC